MDEQVQVNTPLEEQPLKQPSSLPELGSCKSESCRCLHEHGLVAMKNADGSVSQITVAQAKAQLESLKQIEAALGESEAIPNE